MSEVTAVQTCAKRVDLEKYCKVNTCTQYLLAKIGLGTAENEPLEVWGS